MYTLNSADISLYRGVSPDWIPEELKNWFTLHLSGCDKIGNRIQIRISLRHIRFFYYDHDYNDNDWIPEKTTKDDTYEREVGSISLANPKDTGNDILDFPQNLSDLELFENLGKNVDSTSDEVLKKEIRFKRDFFSNVRNCNNNWVERFYGFPFSDRLVKERTASTEENARICFRNFLRYCLLCFIYEFEDRGKAFCGSTIYHEVHDKLRSSDVYNMLSAKLYYSLYLYDPLYCSQNQEKYTYYTQKFAECLMDKKLNKVISPDNYDNINNGQAWFYNPEKELEQILKKNRKQGRKNGATLKEELVSKIRRFMYSKHAIDKAETSCCGKCFFWIAQVFMLLWSVGIMVSSIWLDSGCWNWFYEKCFFVVAFGIIFIIVIISGVYNGKNVINSFFPRIIVAEATAWLTIGLANSVMKGMSWIIKDVKTVVFAIAVVLIVVGTVVFGKVKQHSPYMKGVRNIAKTFLVINHAIFFALVLGCFFRICFYDNLLKHSNVFSEVVYKNHFDAVEKYQLRLENLEKSIHDYRSFVSAMDSSSYMENHNVMVKNIKINASNSYVFNEFGNSIDTITSKFCVDVIIANNEYKMNRLMPELAREIIETKEHLMDNSFETLIDWATVNSEKKIEHSQSEFVSNLMNEVIEQKSSVLVGNNRYFYPKLLVFHALIVLVFAFVTQLFISDKAITEPL